MKNKLIILTLLLSIFSFGCEIEKEYSAADFGGEWKSSCEMSKTAIFRDNLYSLNGAYNILAFKKESTNGSNTCLSFIQDGINTAITPCESQSPVTPTAIRGKVVLSVAENLKEIQIGYRYDIYDNTNQYFTLKENASSSYVRVDFKDENKFSNFSINATNSNGNGNSLLIELPKEGTEENFDIENLKLVTDGGKTTYTFVLSKDNDLNLVTDTHTPVNFSNINEIFITQNPINLDPNDETCKDKNEEFNPFGLIGYYNITRMQVYRTEEYIQNSSAPIYDTNNRTGKFKGEFWIVTPDNFVADLDIGVNLEATLKYQIEDSNFTYPTKDNTSNPKIINFQLPLQDDKDFNVLILKTFELLAEWNKDWNDSARRVIFKPKLKTNTGIDNSHNFIYLDDDKEYVAVLELERYWDSYAEGKSKPEFKLNYNTNKYWN